MATVLIYTYNNYYNRKFKKHDNLADYAAGLVYTETGNALNFNPNDGVNTTFVAGRQNNPYSTDGDYLIYTEDNVNIKSRWFIIESRKNRQGQSILTLRRDVIADYYDNIISDKMFIRKATVAENSPFIINQEPIAVNQIKKSEFELKDDSRMAWIVGFIDRNAFNNGDLTIISSATYFATENVETLEDWRYYRYINKDTYKQDGLYDLNIYATTLEADGTNIFVKYTYNPSTKEWSMQSSVLYINKALKLSIKKPALEFWTYLINAFKNEDFGWDFSVAYQTNTLYAPFESQLEASILPTLNNGILSVKETGNYYRISSSLEKNIKRTVHVEQNLYGDWLKKGITDIIYDYIGGYESGEPYIELLYTYDKATLNLTLLEISDLTVTLKKDHAPLKDAPYDMFCIPYADGITLANNVVTSWDDCISNKETALRVAQDIGAQVGSFIYDIQLLPFCPMTGYISTENKFDINTGLQTRYSLITKQELAKKIPKGVIYWASACQGTFNIIKDIQVGNKKITNQCDLYRLVSPNYNGQFEFNVAKNNGVDFFNVDFTYLPYSSYIHVNPNFKSFYGNDYNDARGLICQGDFSICYLSDKWVEYQINNKNYNNIFNRQIENMDVNHKYDRAGQIVSGIAGAIGVGTAVGGMGGGVAGGVAAGVASLIGAGADIAISESKYKESKSYAEDIFNYQLDNIKAMPNSIAKTTAYTANNKIFPILEYYTCTDEEKDAVAEEIANTGMTLGVIGILSQYLLNEWSYNGIKDRGFIQAKPITLSIKDDYHLASAISEELEKGVYFK